MKVRIGNKEYVGKVACLADSCQWWYNHAANAARLALKYNSECFKRYCREAAELANLYFSRLPEDVQCQLLISKKVEAVD